MRIPDHLCASEWAIFETAARPGPTEEFCWDKRRGKQSLKAVSRPAPDAVLKEYFRNSVHLADMLNAYFYEGRRVILPEELEEMDSVLSVAEDFWSDEQTPDIIRRRVRKLPSGKEITQIYFLENQMYIDRGMEPRVSFSKELIRGLERKKLLDEYRKHRVPGDLYLSSMGPDDVLPLILPLVAYYGDSSWNEPTRALDLIDPEEESARAWENDRGINLFQAATQDLPFSDPSNIALFAAIRARHEDIPVAEKKKKIRDILEKAPKDARDTYLRIWGTDAMREALARGEGEKTVLALLEKDYKEIETMTETIKGQKKTIENRDRTIENLDREVKGQKKTIENRDRTIENLDREVKGQKKTIEDKNAALLRLARTLLQQGVPAPEVATMAGLSLEEIDALSVQGSRA